jgi:uncharacterized protein YgiM (DUF1202 family)
MKKLATYCATSLVITAGIVIAAGAARADSGAALISTNAPVITVVAGEDVRTVTVNNLNLRARPSRTAEVMGQLKKGDQVTVLETKSVVETGKTQEWTRVTLPSTAKCYVLSKLIAEGKVTTDSVNVRSGPGTNFKDIGKLTKGDKVHVVKASGEWTQIKPTEGCAGWVAMQFLEAVPVPAPLPAPPVIELPPAPLVSVIVPEPISLPAPAPLAPPVETLSYYVVKDGIFQTVLDEEKGQEKQLAPYELMTVMVERRQYRMAYLDVAEKNLDKYEGKYVRILGSLKWKRGDRYPVIIVDRIEMIW